MDIQTVVREVTVRGQVQGMDQVARAYDQVASSSDDTSASMAKSGSSAAIAEAAIAKLGQQLQENFQQQQQFNDAMRQQAQAYQQTGAAANDNSDAVKSNGIEWAEIVNHVRQATEAAYAFSPAFASVVNAMIGPALTLGRTAIAGVAAGIVTATNLAGTGLVSLALAAGRVSPAFLPVSSALLSAGLAMEAFNPGLVGITVTIVSKLLPALRLLGPALLVYDAIKAVGDAWTLGGQALQKYVDIANNAAKLDLSTDYFQRITKAATDAKLPVDDLTAALKKLSDASSDKLGGSDLQNRLDELTKAGNFNGNTGGAQLAQANTTQQKFEAVVSLIDQAMQSGQRLAALDLANTAFGPAITTRLSQDSDYLNKLQASAKQISDTQLVSDADIARATDLQARYDAAVAILEQRWHPVQDLLTQAGIQMQAAWVAIVEAIAQAVDYAAKLVEQILKVDASDLATVARSLASAWSHIQNGANAVGNAIVSATTTPESRAASEQSLGISSAPADIAATAAANQYTEALTKLRAGLQNTNAVQQAVAETNKVQQAVWKDTSHAITSAEDDISNAYTRALNASIKQVAQTNAEIDALGLGAGALAAFRTTATLTVAAQQAGIPITQELTDQIDAQAKSAGVTAEALARMKVASQIDFTQKTALLSPEDVSIAQQLKGIYLNDVPKALASSEAAAIRVNDAIKEGRDAGLDFAKSFVQGLLQGKTGMEALTAAAGQLASKMADKALTDLFSGNFLQAGAEGIVAIGADLFSNNGAAQQKLKQAQDTWKKAEPEFETFLKVMSGGVEGDLSQSINQAISQAQDLMQKASDAGDWSSFGQIYQAQNDYIQAQKEQFLATWQATLQGFADGLGPDSPFQKAVSNVKTALNTALGFIDDTNTADAATNAVPAAQYVTQKYLLSLLQTAPAMSAVATGMLNIQGTAAALQGALVQLGMSSADAAAAISSGVTTAIANLKSTFEDSLTQRLNTATGSDYLNDAAALLTQHQQDLADAAALGSDPALMAQVSATFSAEAQKIVNDAGLVGSQFTDFIKLFPDFGDVVTQATGKFTDAINTIEQYLDSLGTGSDSILSPQDQLNLAQQNFSQQLALAQGGDSGALGSITQYASTLLDQAKSYYASSSGYDDIYRAVASALAALTSLGGGASYSNSLALGNSVPAPAPAPVAGSSAAAAQLAQSAPPASNDNGDYFAAQTQALISAIAAATTSEISALQDGVSTLAGKLDKVVSAIAANKPKPLRPAARTAA